MVLELESLETLGAAETPLFDAHRPDAVSSPSGGSGIGRRHLAEPTNGADAATDPGHLDDVVFRLHGRHR